jgi:hypothetical protein
MRIAQAVAGFKNEKLDYVLMESVLAMINGPKESLAKTE